MVLGASAPVLQRQGSVRQQCSPDKGGAVSSTPEGAMGLAFSHIRIPTKHKKMPSQRTKCGLLTLIVIIDRLLL